MSKEQKKLMIGLEVHGYLQTKEKLFCRCKTIRHASKQEIKPNTYICPICAGMPGSKPMLPNSEAIKKIIQIALILNCKINPEFTFQRKHYNWPDLPKGYQDTVSGAYSIPCAENGTFEGIRVREVHLEEDPAAWNPETGCVDYNRSGLPLVEIVTEPDFTNSDQVVNWLQNLVLALSYIKALDKNAGIKADTNVSLYGERIEVKNVNSIEAIKETIEYEAIRQETDKPIKKETRRWDDKKKITTKMREKEDAAEYRFIPEPDLPIVKINKNRIREIKSNLPETPQEKLKKLTKKHKVDKKSAEILHKNFELAEFFEQVAEKIDSKFALPWTTIELLRVLNYNKKRLEEVEIKVEHFVHLLNLVVQNKITELKAKQILNQFIPKSFQVSLSKSEEKITDKKQLEKIAEEAIKKNPKAVSDYKSGNQQSINFLMGEIMKLSNKRADFKLALEVLKQKLK